MGEGQSRKATALARTAGGLIRSTPYTQWCASDLVLREVLMDELGNSSVGTQSLQMSAKTKKGVAQTSPGYSTHRLTFGSHPGQARLGQSISLTGKSKRHNGVWVMPGWAAIPASHTRAWIEHWLGWLGCSPHQYELELGAGLNQNWDLHG